MSNFDLQVVTFEGEEAAQICAIRRAVFTDEQQVDPAIDLDGQDADAVQLLVELDGWSVATGRMLADGRIGRLAVLAPARGLGIGAAMVEALVAIAGQAGYPRIYLGAQEHAIEFYRRLGFVPYGDPYIEANIPHQKMERLLK